MRAVSDGDAYKKAYQEKQSVDSPWTLKTMGSEEKLRIQQGPVISLGLLVGDPYESDVGGLDLNR